MSLTEKAHFPLLLFDDDTNKTPLGNTNKEAFDWWSSLSRKGQQQALLEYGGIDDAISDWEILTSIYDSVHNKV